MMRFAEKLPEAGGNHRGQQGCRVGEAWKLQKSPPVGHSIGGQRFCFMADQKAGVTTLRAENLFFPKKLIHYQCYGQGEGG